MDSFGSNQNSRQAKNSQNIRQPGRQGNFTCQKDSTGDVCGLRTADNSPYGSKLKVSDFDSCYVIFNEERLRLKVQS